MPLASGIFSIPEASSVAIIGGADGATAMFTAARLSPELLGIIGVVAYTYMASVALIQPPIMRLLTTKNEREIEMGTLREVSKAEKLIFPLMAMVAIILLVTQSAPLITMFMVGNLFKEPGVVPRLANASSNEIINIVTTVVMLSIGSQMSADRVLNLDTLAILGPWPGRLRRHSGWNPFCQADERVLSGEDQSSDRLRRGLIGTHGRQDIPEDRTGLQPQ